MATTMDLDTIPDLLSEQRDNAPADYQHYFLTFEDYWERKLWHELTDTLVEYFALEESASQRLPLYNTFIKSFSEKINRLKLVTLGLAAARTCRDDQSRLTFLQTLTKKVNTPSSQDAYVYATVALAQINLTLDNSSTAKSLLDTAESILDTFDAVETVVHASFYKTSADYYKAKHEFAAYYRTALLYLACVELEELSEVERQARAHDLALAALVSDSIYNFGELLLHPVLDSLKDTSYAWLRELLFAFNRGDLDAYGQLKVNIKKNELLAAHETFLYQKISLAALTEAVFRRPPHDRAMHFSTIEKETKVRNSEIEHLIMKALSLGLVRGQIDQVAEVAKINWVQPKVLDKTQIVGMRGRLKEWDASVNELGTWIEGKGRDVWAA